MASVLDAFPEEYPANSMICMVFHLDMAGVAIAPGCSANSSARLGVLREADMDLIHGVIAIVNQWGVRVCDYSLAMLVQSGILVGLLLILDLLLQPQIDQGMRGDTPLPGYA